MTKLDKDAFISKYSEKLKDSDDLALELFEDIADSINTDTTELDALKNELEVKTQEYDDLKARYKERFLSGKPPIDEKPLDDKLYKNVVDIKEI